MLARTRAFFAARGVLEVETPILARHTVTDPRLHSLETRFTGPGAADGERLFLQTSPEFAMKRLLCAGAGPIWQLARVFRDDERGRLHNPEFTLLEWYRPGFDHHALMDEAEALVVEILDASPGSDRLTWAEAFNRHLGLDPHAASVGELEATATARGLLSGGSLELDRDGWLDLLLTHVIQPELGRDRPCFLYDYPASQAALARIRAGRPPVAERFELFIRGIELANGYHELGDAAEQRARFEQDNRARHEVGLPEVTPDERLLAALGQGLPDCAGVALGFDRLVMLAAGAAGIDEVMAFPLDRA